MMSAGAAMTKQTATKVSRQLGLGGPVASKLSYFDRQLRVSPKRSLVSRDQMGRFLEKALKLADAPREGSPYT